ncbi:MAG: hypothetical protein MUO42_02645, partial [Anaerolineaceae bacterium]|nr:hypothetical protein [Anaerolineaceae bacterium]
LKGGVRGDKRIFNIIVRRPPMAACFISTKKNKLKVSSNQTSVLLDQSKWLFIGVEFDNLQDNL